MAVIREVSLPLADYPSGTRQIPARGIPNSAQSLYFELARCTDADPTIWPSETTRVQFDFEGSFDGVVWAPAGGFGALGGIQVRRDSVQAAISSFTVQLPAGVNRQIRATVTIANGPLRTQGTVELRD